jgi:hypothetical protein
MSVRSIFAALGSFALLSFGVNAAYRWVAQQAVSNSGKPIAGFEAKPIATQNWDFSAGQSLSQVGTFSVDN